MILLKFKTEIKGDSTIKEHENWIALKGLNFSCGRLISLTSTGTDRETSTPSFTDIQCVKEIDIASVELFSQSICGKSLVEAEIHFLQTGGKDADQVYLKMFLADPIVTSYNQAATSGARIQETFALNYTSIKLEYTQFSGEVKKSASPKAWNRLKGESEYKKAG
jgi:type VI secretion system secreted protein Hcp